MPLLRGNTPEVVSQNVREMVQAGHPENVAVAAALANAKKHGAGEAHLKAKRPGLHPDHPFNSKNAPDNRRKVASPVPTPAAPKPFVAADHPGRDFRGEKVVNGVKMRV